MAGVTVNYNGVELCLAVIKRAVKDWNSEPTRELLEWFWSDEFEFWAGGADIGNEILDVSNFIREAACIPELENICWFVDGGSYWSYEYT